MRGLARATGLIVAGMALVASSPLAEDGRAEPHHQLGTERGTPFPGSASIVLDNAVVRPGDATSYVVSLDTTGSDVLGPVPLAFYGGENPAGLPWMETTINDVYIFSSAGVYTSESIFAGETVGGSTLIGPNFAQPAVPVSLPNNTGLDQPVGGVARITFRVPVGTIPGSYVVQGTFSYSYFLPEFPFFHTATLNPGQVTTDTLTVLRAFGDMDGNGSVGIEDVASYIDVLLGTNTNPDDIDTADISRDGNADGVDVQLFVDLLT